MKTITFYSYKGGTGRSLALANAARYLARLDFRVVAVDFDLEAPGLHYKFSKEDGMPLTVDRGIVDYLHSFIVDGESPRSLKAYTVGVVAPGIDKSLIQLIPAGRAPSSEYWSKLSRINWHQLFYSESAKGVQIFLELKNRIIDELEPDFLLVDSRTGITEMAGVATTLLPDKVICLVLPSLENLEGAREVLRSLKHSQRERGMDDLDVMIALSRLPQMKGSEDERVVTERIKRTMNEEAEDLRDTLACTQVFVLHSETPLQITETLRVGSGISPDDSILLRDYLRLFASVVPKESIETKVHDSIERAKQKIWDDPDAAVKEVEELAESFGHPENYRTLLRFYEVRNVGGPTILRRAQQLWELTGDPKDPILWQVVSKTFEPKPRWQRKEREWQPNLDFVRAVWRESGNKDPVFGLKLAGAYDQEDRESLAADVLLEIIRTAEPSVEVVSRCVDLLDTAERGKEADALIQQFSKAMASQPEFAEAWARHALRGENKDALSDLRESPALVHLTEAKPSLAAMVYFKAGLKEQAAATAASALREGLNGRVSEHTMFELGELYSKMGKWDEFFASARDVLPSAMLEEIARRFSGRRRW